QRVGSRRARARLPRRGRRPPAQAGARGPDARDADPPPAPDLSGRLPSGRRVAADGPARLRSVRARSMTTSPFSLRRLHALDDAQIDQLAGLTIDCVEGGASIGFMHPLTRERAVAFWRRVAEGVARGERALLVAEDERGLCGTVQLLLEMPDNQ